MWALRQQPLHKAACGVIWGMLLGAEGFIGEKRRQKTVYTRN
jgi:hypothetical protein